MRLYKITAVSGADNKTLWVGSQGDAGKTRKGLVESGFKRAEITTEEVDVPTNKEGLLGFLNGSQ